MKIKAIEAICKAHKHITLCNTERGQWIGVGSAAYPLRNIPMLTEDHLFAIFDIPEDKQSRFYIESKSELPSEYDFSDATKYENLLEPYPIEISAYGGIIVPIVTSLGVVFINKKYLKPFEDSERGVDLYERVNDAGRLYIAVKDGFMLCGIILPIDIINEEFAGQLKKLYELTNVSLQNQAAAKLASGQMDITEALGSVKNEE